MSQPAREPTVVPCSDLDAAIDRYTARGYRLQAIGPADEPTWAELTDHDTVVVLDTATDGGRRWQPGDARPNVPPAASTLAISHQSDDGWVEGRAGMRYRDLVASRYGGAYIASHIHVPDGGPVPDYVHHHDIAYQLIFCHRGWVKVVYQDQGPPFVMYPGDCVLQPPGIRHRVLESSDDLYVVEITCPADHRTNVDHTLELPTGPVRPDRTYGGQRFVRHRGETAPWIGAATEPFEEQVTAIGQATDGLATVRLLRPFGDGPIEPWPLDHRFDFRFLFMLIGGVSVGLPGGETVSLGEGSSVTIPGDGDGYAVTAVSDDARLLEVCSTVPPS